LGGLILGLFGGGLLLILVSLFSALAAPAPTVEPTSPDRSDLRISLNENFLNRFIDQPAEGAVNVDILPANQIRVVANTSLDAFGLPVPVEITGLFQLQISAGTLKIFLLDSQVSGVTLPPEFGDFFSEDVALINRDLQMMVDEISNTLGIPITLIGLTTDDTQIQLEIRARP
jgi:hypothetical protein